MKIVYLVEGNNKEPVNVQYPGCGISLFSVVKIKWFTMSILRGFSDEYGIASFLRRV